MADTSAANAVQGYGRTQRRDAWWAENIPFIIVLGLFVVYTTWRALQGKYYWSDPYLSPFYSPLIDPQHHWWPFSPAILILGGPGGFRLTCYYYRKAYYRAFGDPAACAVSEKGKKSYCGETSFPFILQNVHRYFFYIVCIILAFLWYDTIIAFRFPNGFGIGVGTVIMLVNVILLSIYSLSCHSFRHLMGGKLDCFSCVKFGPSRNSVWLKLTKLNEHHMFWAWVSMISVGLTDLYIYLLAIGYLKDIRLL